MYYLRSATHMEIIDGKECCVNDRAIFKHNTYPRFYREDFFGIKDHPTGMRLYTCKTLKKILEIREQAHRYFGEWFDVYDEQGKIDLDNPPENREQTITLPCHIGDKLYYIVDNGFAPESYICEYEVVGGSTTQLFAYNMMGDLRPYDRSEIGKTVFFTKKEAEEELSNRK